MKTNLRIMASMPTFLTACLLFCSVLVQLWLLHRFYTTGELHGPTGATPPPHAIWITLVPMVVCFWAAFLSHRNRAALWICALIGSALALFGAVGIVALCLHFKPSLGMVAISLLLNSIPLAAGLCGAYSSFVLLFMKDDARHA